MYEIKEIPGYEGYYADTNGEIWSVWRTGCKGGAGEVRHKMKLTNKGGGYLIVNLSGGKGNLLRRVNRLIAETFIVNTCGNPFVCHRDGNPENNSVGNLYWGTQKQNMADKLLHGTDQRGEKCPTAKLTQRQVRAIRSLKARSNIRQGEIAQMFKVSPTTISMILNKKSWHYAFII